MRKLAWLAFLAVAATLLAIPNVVPAVSARMGNGAPSGQHFTLNIIGVDKGKNPPMNNSDRHTIFVPLWKTCGIGLTQTPNWSGTYSTQDFQVLDGNCFDGDGISVTTTTSTGTVTKVLSYKLDAGFQLPPPDPTAKGTLQYTVFAKVLSPKGVASMQTCFQDTTGTYCNTGYQLSLSKVTYPKFNDVSKNLLTVCASLDGGTTWSLQPLFFNSAYTYWWEYDNQGLRHTQLRFYPNTKANSAYAGTACTANAK